MACNGFWECLLKLLNFLLTLTGLAMVGYGIYLLVIWNKASSSGVGEDLAMPTGSDPEFLKLGRPMLVAVSLSSSFLDHLPKAWYVMLLIPCSLSEGISVHLFVYWCWDYYLCHIMLWLHWSINKNWVLPVLCILTF
ncbi:hypothetical protein BHE74_00041631 [Ensete ventricosum]|nr:hypothetical protein BHE74_00041631 [Ensete ventricosum]